MNYHKKVVELEEYVKKLSGQMEALPSYQTAAPRYGNPMPPLSKLVTDKRNSPQKTEEGPNLILEGVNVVQPGRPIGGSIPHPSNTLRETRSQQRVAQKIKREATSKEKKRVRNYNLKDDNLS